jgi:hypothetical protein
LYLVDRYGGEVKVDEEIAIPDGAIRNLTMLEYFVLSKGDRMVLRVNGNVTVGDGVILTVASLQLTPNAIRRFSRNEKITQSVLEFSPEGVSPFANLLCLMNVSANDVVAQAETEYPGGFVSSYNESILAGTAISTSFSPLGNTKITLSGLPSSGYLYGSFIQLVPMAEMSPEFFKV